MAQSILDQTGWIRPYPKSICQETDVLLSINSFDYDLLNEDFRRYFTARTGIVVTAKCSQRCDEDVKTTWEKNLKGRLQDAWELFRHSLRSKDEIKLKIKPVQLDLFF